MTPLYQPSVYVWNIIKRDYRRTYCYRQRVNVKNFNIDCWKTPGRELCFACVFFYSYFWTFYFFTIIIIAAYTSRYDTTSRGTSDDRRIRFSIRNDTYSFRLHSRPLHPARRIQHLFSSRWNTISSVELHSVHMVISSKTAINIRSSAIACFAWTVPRRSGSSIRFNCSHAFAIYDRQSIDVL